MMDRVEDFRKELSALINRHSMERAGGNRADYVLAEHLVKRLVELRDDPLPEPFTPATESHIRSRHTEGTRKG